MPDEETPEHPDEQLEKSLEDRKEDDIPPVGGDPEEPPSDSKEKPAVAPDPEKVEEAERDDSKSD